MSEINTFDKLSHVMRTMANTAAMCVAYPTWTDEFARKEVDEVWRVPKGLRKQIGDGITAAEILALTDKEKRVLGFGQWDEESGLWLLPLYVFHYIADGEKLKSISGSSATKGVDEIDLDVRMGCIAFGVQP